MKSTMCSSKQPAELDIELKELQLSDKNTQRKLINKTEPKLTDYYRKCPLHLWCEVMPTTRALFVCLTHTPVYIATHIDDAELLMFHTQVPIHFFFFAYLLSFFSTHTIKIIKKLLSQDSEVSQLGEHNIMCTFCGDMLGNASRKKLAWHKFHSGVRKEDIQIKYTWICRYGGEVKQKNYLHR